MARRQQFPSSQPLLETLPDLAREAGVSRDKIIKLESGQVDPGFSDMTPVFEALDRLEAKLVVRVRDISTKDVTVVNIGDSVSTAAKRMRENGLSQLPVIHNGKIVGCLTDKAILTRMIYGLSPEEAEQMRVSELMEEAFPMVSDDTLVASIVPLLKDTPAVIVTKKGAIAGIVTRTDVLDFQKRRPGLR